MGKGWTWVNVSSLVSSGHIYVSPMQNRVILGSQGAVRVQVVCKRPLSALMCHQSVNGTKDLRTWPFGFFLG